MPDFNLLQTPNFAQAALGGYQAGRKIGQERRMDQALQLYAKDPDAGVTAISALDPEKGETLRKAAQERRSAEAMSRVFASPAPRQASAGEGGGEPSPAAPSDPGSGIHINQEALGELFKIDPKMGFQIQQFTAKASADQLKQVQDRLAAKANAAGALLELPPGPERQAAFQQLRPVLLQQGFTEQELGTVDLSDNMLVRDKLMGMTFEQRLSERDRTADNARQDRALQSSEADRRARLGLAYKSDARASQARSEGRVRFNERGKDRAALAASGRSGGIPTSIDDLDY